MELLTQYGVLIAMPLLAAGCLTAGFHNREKSIILERTHIHPFDAGDSSLAALGYFIKGMPEFLEDMSHFREKGIADDGVHCMLEILWTFAAAAVVLLPWRA